MIANLPQSLGWHWFFPENGGAPSLRLVWAQTGTETEGTCRYAAMAFQAPSPPESLDGPWLENENVLFCASGYWLPAEPPAPNVQCQLATISETDPLAASIAQRQ